MDLNSVITKDLDRSSFGEVINCLSQAIDDNLTNEDKMKVLKRVHKIIDGGHYDETFAKYQVSKMYYTDNEGDHYGPYYTLEQAKEIYKRYKEDIPTGYNLYDFYVALNMIQSDYTTLVHKWFKDLDKDSFEQKILDLTLNWLNDTDNPFGNTKVWGYFNP